MEAKQPPIVRIATPTIPKNKPKWLGPVPEWEGLQAHCVPYLILALDIMKENPKRMKLPQHDRWGMYTKDGRALLRRKIFEEMLSFKGMDASKAHIKEILRLAATFRFIQICGNEPTVPARIPGRPGTDRCICFCIDTVKPE